MNNDLISRSTLKEDMKSRLSACNEWIEKAKDKETKIRASTVKAFIAEVIMTIDNAPTVEPFEPDYVGAERVKARQRGYEQGYHEGMKIGKTLNPKIKQGEWKRGEFGSYCSICGYAEYRYLGTGPKHDHNFCPECGADMKTSD